MAQETGTEGDLRRFSQSMIFFIIVIVVFALMYGYIGWRLIIPAAFGLPVNILLWSLLAVLLILPFLPVFARNQGEPNLLMDVIAWIAYISFGFMTLLFAVLVIKDLVFLTGLGLQKIVLLFSKTAQAGVDIPDAVDPHRRQLLINSVNLGLLGLTTAVTGYGIFQALRKPQIVEIDLPVPNLPTDLEGFRIVQITDIHVSHTIKRDFVQMVVDTVNGLKPDIIALTGDLVDGSVPQLRHDVAPLADLKAPYGSFFITGNHEYYSGAIPWVKETTRLGFDVLMNEHRVIQHGKGKILLAGVTDYTGGDFYPDHVSDPHKAIAGAVSDCHVKILLAHQPKSIFEASKAGFDYVISGHTHGGQYIPYHFLAALAQPYISGFHKHDNTYIYVSNGTGYWGPPLRIGTGPEITLHRLARA